MRKNYGVEVCRNESCKEEFEKKTAVHRFCCSECQKEQSKRDKAREAKADRDSLIGLKKVRIPKKYLVRGKIVNLKRYHE